jgi:uncharacterized protein (TIGR02001 family)
MKHLLTRTAVLALAVSGSSAFAQESVAPEETGLFATKNFSATVALTNQYMFRGISNSDGPAIQGSFDWTYNGWFLGAWASNTEFSDGNLEIDYYGGYRWSWSGLDMVVQGIGYTFPGEDKCCSEGLDPAGVDADYAEVNIGVSHTFPGQLAPSVSVNYFYSPDTFGEDGDNHTVTGGFGLTLPQEFGLYANIGYTDFEGDKVTGAIGGYDYVFFSVGVNKTIKGFKLDLGYVGTDESSDLETVYPKLPGSDNPRDLITGEVVFSVSHSF